MRGHAGRFLYAHPVWFVVLVTLGVASLSIAVSFTINALKGEIYPLFDWLFPSAFTPLAITPVVVTTFVRMSLNSERLRKQIAESAERERLLTLEMRHRIKNIYAATAGLITLAEREAEPGGRDRAPEILRQKLAALARASEATFAPDRSGGSLDLESMVRSVLKPYGANIRISGEAVGVGERVMTSCALLLHELATNSLKYGSLSAPAGGVNVVWTRADGRIRFRWEESGGPRISAPPAHSGFGSTVIDRFIKSLSGEIRYDWAPSGLCVDATLPEE